MSVDAGSVRLTEVGCLCGSNIRHLYADSEAKTHAHSFFIGTSLCG